VGAKAARGNEDYKRAVAIANLAGTWNSDLDFEVFDVKWGGSVKKYVSSIPKRHESARFVCNKAQWPLVND
jgi:hypothetical protein